MECLQCMNRISEYLDHELSTLERQDMEAHLEECSDCRNLMNELNTLSEATRLSIESIPVPPGLTDSIILSIQAEKQRTSKNQWFTGILLILLSSPLLVLLTRTFSSVFNLMYVTGAAFWRSSMTLLNLVSPGLMLSLGIFSGICVIASTFVIKKLIHDFQLNEVFQ